MKFTQINWPISLSSFLLLSVGILVIFSSSKELALQQSIFASIGLLLYFFISQFDHRAFQNLISPFYILIILLLMVVLFLGVETRGALRWIPLGVFHIQPSEFAKPILILFLSKFWSNNLPNWRNILKSLIFTLPVALLIFKQPDLGSFLTVLAIWLGLLLAARISIKKFTGLVFVLLVVVPLGWFTLHQYQRQRVYSFLSPQSDPLGVGYNLIQSTIAVGSGQVFGRGLGLGTQSRLQFLPEFRTDFIFASIAEEMGFIGSIIILTIYLFLIIYCLKSAEGAVDLFGYLIIFGTVSMVLFQTFVNVGMNIGILPITGITLPLISYGGSSLISTLISLGLAAAVIRQHRVDIQTLGR